MGVLGDNEGDEEALGKGASGMPSAEELGQKETRWQAGPVILIFELGGEKGEEHQGG